MGIASSNSVMGIGIVGAASDCWKHACFQGSAWPHKRARTLPEVHAALLASLFLPQEAGQNALYYSHGPKLQDW